MTYDFKAPLRFILMTTAAFTITACGQANTEATHAQDNGQASSAFKVAHVDAQGAHALLASKPDTVVLDIRSPKEIEDGYINGAVFANFFDEDFAQQLTKFDRNTPYIVHCKGGGRSTKALTTLEALGFTNVTHMDGGLDGWKREKLPLTKS